MKSSQPEVYANASHSFQVLYPNHYISMYLAEYLAELCLFEVKELRVLRGFFGPHMSLKYKNCFSPISYLFIRTIIKVLKSQITFDFYHLYETKMAAKIGH